MRLVCACKGCQRIIKMNFVARLLLGTGLFVFVGAVTFSRWAGDNEATNEVDDEDRLLFQPTSDPDLAFASYYGNHMVLQQAPQRANVWGYASLTSRGQPVDLLLQAEDGSYRKSYRTTVSEDVWKNRLIWTVTLDQVKAGGPYNLTATLSGSTVVISDVMFGDVWLCSGQSNMEFTVTMMLNGSEEISEAGNFPLIRLFTVGHYQAKGQAMRDLENIEQPWQVASKESVGNGKWTYFSAVCWMYGKLIHQNLKYPIGLISSTWGGTPIEAWSSGRVMTQCGIPPQGYSTKRVGRLSGPNAHSALFYGMIYPFIKMTIYGAIWYQGENNANSGANMNKYNCTFPAMIEDWRETFSKASSTTSPQFPFGFVQLAPNRNITARSGFTDIRWHQTADLGYAPNSILQNVFMAVAMDLPDFNSTYGSIHPRDKVTVGHRLSLAGRAVAYKQNVKYQGPRISNYKLDTTKGTLQLLLDQGKTKIHVKNLAGFEVCCCQNNQSDCSENATLWQEVPIVHADLRSVTLSLTLCSRMWLLGLRYAWNESPCAYKQCAVYSVENDLPMAPDLILGFHNNDPNKDVWSTYQ